MGYLIKGSSKMFMKSEMEPECCYFKAAIAGTLIFDRDPDKGVVLTKEDAILLIKFLDTKDSGARYSSEETSRSVNWRLPRPQVKMEESGKSKPVVEKPKTGTEKPKPKAKLPESGTAVPKAEAKVPDSGTPADPAPVTTPATTPTQSESSESSEVDEAAAKFKAFMED